MSEAFDITFVDLDDRSGRFVVRGASPAFANGLRRAMLADVPTLAIDTVRVIENSSVMFNEQLGLRLGLIPLTTPDDYQPDEIVTLALDVEGPGTAYSGDLVSADDQVQPADENIPIIDLKEDQRLEVEADARLSTGKDHAKHQGGVAVGYSHLRRVEVDGELEDFADPEPVIVRGVVEDDGELVPSEEFNHDLRNRYPEAALSVTDVSDAFVFHVETDGSIDIASLVDRAAASLSERAAELETAIAL